MNLGITLRTALMLECFVCHENRQAGDWQDGYIDVAMCGLVASYTVCPGCLQSVDWERQQDPDYQRRCRVTYFERFGMIIRYRPGVAAGAIV